MKGIKKSGFIAILLIAVLILPYFRVQAKAVKLNKTKCMLSVGETVKLKLKNATGKVTWSSSSKKIAKVSKKGLVTAKAAGTVVITAKNNGKKYKCTITIGDKGMPKGKWYDKNGSTMLEFKGNKMYAYWWANMDEPEEFDVKIEKSQYGNEYILNAKGEYGGGFGIMSRLEIEEDGTLSAYEEVLDAEGHNYKFVTEDKIEEEMAVKDFSSDKPKVIESKDIKSFSLYLHHYSSEKLYSGSYSWEIKKKADGKYEFKFDGMGSSYVIIQYDQEVEGAYVQGLQKMIDEAELAGYNGMFFSHDKSDVEYSMYII